MSIVDNEHKTLNWNEKKANKTQTVVCGARKNAFKIDEENYFDD